MTIYDRLQNIFLAVDLYIFDVKFPAYIKKQFIKKPIVKSHLSVMIGLAESV